MARAARAQKSFTGEQLKGELLSFTVKTQDHWGFGMLRTGHDSGDVKITGKVLGAKIGDTVLVEGWFEDSKWGRSFKVRSCEVVIPTDASGVIGWLSSNLPQVSRRRAEELVERFGVDGTWAVLEGGNVADLTWIDGITPERAQHIFEAYRASREDRDRVVRFKSWGLTDNQIGKVLAEWGESAEQKLQHNPYLLIKHVDGFGWVKADAVAKRMGVAPDSFARIAAGIVDVMNDAVGLGNVYVPFGAVVRVAAEKKLGLTKDAVEPVLKEMLKASGREAELVCRGAKVYLARLASAETKLAEVFAARAKAVRGV